MSLSASFSDLPSSNGTPSSFTAGASIAHARSTASSMGLIPVIPAESASHDAAARQADDHSPATDRRNQVAPPRAGRAGMERRQFGSSHAGLSAEGRDLAAAIDAYKLQHHRRYITCDEMLIVISSLGYEQQVAANEAD